MLAVYLYEDLVDVESVAIASVFAFQSPDVHCAELDAPQADRFTGYSDASFCEQIFDIAVAEVEVEAIVEPDCVTDDVGWESVAFVYIHSPILPVEGI